MSHYITVPVNENGIVFDPTMNEVVREAMAPDPFRFADVYIYSHGWSTNAVSALDVYNRFSVDYAKRILLDRGANSGAFAAPPEDSLGIGIHWPSQITEDSDSALNGAQLLTFYTMEHRADAVGRNAVYTMLRLILKQRADGNLPVRIFMVGHSFGCKVVLSALQDLQTDIDGKNIVVPAGSSFNVVLLQAATDNNHLEPADIYGSVCRINNLRLLMTTSELDKALGTWYPLAGKLANLLHPEPVALGHGGPTPATFAENVFGAPGRLVVKTGFGFAEMANLTNRLVIADLTSVHQDRVSSGQWPGGGFSGSHSDISFDEIYRLISGFFYRAVVADPVLRAA